jgi:hypothetical protein
MEQPIMSLLDTLDAGVQRQKQDRAAAMALYVELLQRQDNQKPGDAKALADVMKALGLSDGDVRQDAAAVAAVKRAASQLIPAQEILRLTEALGAASDAHSRARAEWWRAEDRLMEEITKAGSAYHTAVESNKTNERTIEQQRQRRPMAFGLEPQSV